MSRRFRCGILSRSWWDGLLSCLTQNNFCLVYLTTYQSYMASVQHQCKKQTSAWFGAGFCQIVVSKSLGHNVLVQLESVYFRLKLISFAEYQAVHLPRKKLAMLYSETTNQSKIHTHKYNPVLSQLGSNNGLTPRFRTKHARSLDL